MNQNIILSPITLEELETRLVNRFKAELAQVAQPQGQQPEEELITVKQAAKLLGVSHVTIHQWKKTGKLKFYRFGTRIRFKKSEVVGTEKFRKP